MPYTPPTQRSPASSNPNSPILSRNQSYISEPHAGAPAYSSQHRRPALPRSASSIAYLNKHRRSPSFQTNDSQKSQSVTVTSPSDGRVGASANGSLRQSPSPVNNLLIPSGAITTPPDSSSDEEDRGRQLGNLAELQEALQSIELKRQHSPIRRTDGTVSAPPAAMSPISPEDSPSPNMAMVRTTLTPEARRISHSRSNSDIALSSHAVALADSPLNSSDDSDDDECLKIKPPLLRKKSGELVKPALRGPYKRRPSSAPGTPTFKNVHFNEELTSIRHFRDSERPIAVSAGSSPVENYDSESEYPFVDDGYGPRPAGWEIRLANFPEESYERKTLPVRLERLFLSSDSKTLIGTVAAANIAFQKLVVARFTLDYWKTTSEVVAEYNNDVRKKQTNDGYDRFNFSIKLADQAHLESKTLLLCVRYNVNGQEFWDNNNTMNYQVDFIKKTAQRQSKGGKHGHSVGTVGAVPRSRHNPPTTRPRSYPNADDDFSDGFESGRYPPLRLKTKSNKSSRSSNLSTRRPTVAAGAHGLSNRYDFSASLNAALSTAQTALGNESGIKPKQRTTPSKPTLTVPPMLGQRPGGFSSEKPTLESAEYNELIEKYCFYGSSGQSNKPSKLSLQVSTQDGAVDDAPEKVVQNDSDSGSGSLSNSGSNSPLIINTSYPTANDGAGDRKSPLYLSRSSSPGPLTGSDLSRGPSPIRFGYPYNHNVTGGIFVESHAPQATCG